MKVKKMPPLSRDGKSRTLVGFFDVFSSKNSRDSYFRLLTLAIGICFDSDTIFCR